MLLSADPMSLHFSGVPNFNFYPQISMVVTMGSKAFGLCSRNSNHSFLRLRTCTVFYEPTCSFFFVLYGYKVKAIDKGDQKKRRLPERKIKSFNRLPPPVIAMQMFSENWVSPFHSNSTNFPKKTNSLPPYYPSTRAVKKNG